jgi:hypothetical protein
MHNPYARFKEEEFQIPTGEWWLTCRSIVYDSWLFWSDALPEELELREKLDETTFDNITALARRLHSFHVSLSGYKQLNESPFKVSKWWDPTDPDPQWSSGRSCLFTIESFEAIELVQSLPKRTSRPILKLKPISTNFVEAYLPPTPPEKVIDQKSQNQKTSVRNPSSCHAPARLRNR